MPSNESDNGPREQRDRSLPESATDAARAATWEPVRTIDGQPLLGGEGQIRVRSRSVHGILLEVLYPAGVASPIHKHDHESHLYLLTGHLGGTVDGASVDLLPGDAVFHPAGVAHSVVALVDSHWLEFKAPPGEPWKFL